MPPIDWGSIESCSAARRTPRSPPGSCGQSPKPRRRRAPDADRLAEIEVKTKNERRINEAYAYLCISADSRSYPCFRSAAVRAGDEWRVSGRAPQYRPMDYYRGAHEPHAMGNARPRLWFGLARVSSVVRCSWSGSSFKSSIQPGTGGIRVDRKSTRL